jgi:hypothetical protein
VENQNQESDNCGRPVTAELGRKVLQVDSDCRDDSRAIPSKSFDTVIWLEKK